MTQQTITPDATENGLRRPRRARRGVVLFPLVVAAGLFFGPAVAFVGGDRAEPIDNRPLSEFPSIDEGWAFFPAFQAWASDHLPLRSQAVTAGTRISEGVFGEPPRFSSGGLGVAGAGSGAAPTGDATEESGVAYPTAIAGDDGWLFFGADVQSACEPQESLETIMDGFQTLSDAATDSGRKLVIAIAPDKSSAHRALMPDVFAGRDCMDERRAEFWQATGELEGVTLLDPKPALEEFEESTGRFAWRKYDTHWNQEGATVFSQEVVAALDPSLLASTTVRQGETVDADGDLASLIGDPKSEPLISTVIDRPGVTVYLDREEIDTEDVPSLPYSPLTVTAESAGAPLYEPKTYLLGDSFFEAARTKFPPYFRSLTYVHNMAGEIPGSTDVIAAGIGDSETIVYELVERAAVAGAVSFQKPANYEALAEAMRANPIRN